MHWECHLHTVPLISLVVSARCTAELDKCFSCYNHNSFPFLWKRIDNYFISAALSSFLHFMILISFLFSHLAEQQLYQRTNRQETEQDKYWL